MKLFLILCLAILPIIGQSEIVGLDAKNPGCDPEVHACSDDITG